MSNGRTNSFMNGKTRQGTVFGPTPGPWYCVNVLHHIWFISALHMLPSNLDELDVGYQDLFSMSGARAESSFNALIELWPRCTQHQNNFNFSFLFSALTVFSARFWPFFLTRDSRMRQNKLVAWMDDVHDWNDWSLRQAARSGHVSLVSSVKRTCSLGPWPWMDLEPRGSLDRGSNYKVYQSLFDHGTSSLNSFKCKDGLVKHIDLLNSIMWHRVLALLTQFATWNANVFIATAQLRPYWMFSKTPSWLRLCRTNQRYAMVGVLEQPGVELSLAEESRAR